jgi:hypothetical protein
MRVESKMFYFSSAVTIRELLALRQLFELWMTIVETTRAGKECGINEGRR